MPLPSNQIYTSEDYWNLPNDERAELIDGKLYAMAPPSRIHQEIVSGFTQVIRNYIKQHRGDCKVYPAPFAVNLDADDKNWVEPDISVICDQGKLTDRGCSGAPDWIVEVVSPSTQGMDYMTKLLLYRKSGVKEYWIVNPLTQGVMVYDFYQDHFTAGTFDSPIQVGIYPDLTITIQELL